MRLVGSWGKAKKSKKRKSKKNGLDESAHSFTRILRRGISSGARDNRKNAGSHFC
jgi:hypothetical protein